MSSNCNPFSIDASWGRGSLYSSLAGGSHWSRKKQSISSLKLQGLSYWRIISLLMLSSALSSLQLTLNTYSTTRKDFGVWFLVLRSSGAYTPCPNGWGRTGCPSSPGRYWWGHAYPKTFPLWCTQHPQLTCSCLPVPSLSPQHSWEGWSAIFGFGVTKGYQCCSRETKVKTVIFGE